MHFFHGKLHKYSQYSCKWKKRRLKICIKKSSRWKDTVVFSAMY